MRTKVTLVLIFLNVALFFFIFKFERNWRTDEQEKEARRRVLGPEAADIRRLEISTINHAGEFGLERRRDAWLLTKPFEWPANFHAATSIATALQVLEHEASFGVADLAKNGQSIADYGLEKPKMVVAFSSGDPVGGGGGPRTELRVGDTTRDGKRVYLLSPDGRRIHVVDRSKIESLSLPLEQLRADRLFSVQVFEARSLTVHMAANATEAARAAVAPLRVRIRREPAGNRWTFETPINAQASRTAVELTVNALNTLRVKSFVSSSATSMPSSAPVVRITLEGNNRTETLFLGDAVNVAGAVPTPRPADPRAGSTGTPNPADIEYYAQLDGRSALFTVVVPTALLDALRTAPETLREKRFLDFDPRAITALTLAAPLQPNLPPLTLQRLDAPAGQNRDNAPNWQLVRRAEGSQGLQTLPADTAMVQRLLDRLTLLTADRFKSDAPTFADLEEWGFNRPARELTLTVAGRNTPLVLQLGTDASRNVYARVGTPNEPGTSIYSVSQDLVENMPLTPLAWRDRSVGEPLPAASKFTALKLTDLEEKKVVFEVAIAPGGEMTPPPRDPKAVQDLIAALRNLRAKEFLPGGLTEKVVARGEERPWRFELVATVALPGAATAAQPNPLTLLLTERITGNQQFAGSKSLDLVFALEQPLIDAIWSLTYGARDPGSRSENK